MRFNRLRLSLRMKKLLLLSAVLLGTAVASRADVSLRIGIPLPPLPHIVIGHPAPRYPVVVSRPYPAPVVVAPRYCPPPVVCAPPPRVVYAPRRVVYVPRHTHCGHFRTYGECRHYRY